VIYWIPVYEIDSNSGMAFHPNIDDASTGTSLMDYRRGTDLEHVPKELFSAE